MKILTPVPGRALGNPYGDRVVMTIGGIKTSAFHGGRDVLAYLGDEIRAGGAGTVVSVQTGWYRDSFGRHLARNVHGERIHDGTAGNYVGIRFDSGAVVTYAHALAVLVGVGQRVDVGTAVARVGSTGLSTAPHLHITAFASLDDALAWRRIDPDVLFDWTPAAPVLVVEVTSPERDDDMAVFEETTNTIGWPNGWTSSYDRGVFMACRMTEDYARRGEALPADYRFAYDTWLRERWAAVFGIQRLQVLTLQQSGVLPKSADVGAIAKAVTEELLGKQPKAVEPAKLLALAAPVDGL